ncbi:DUF4261 domain-containing protein [Bradyrhizobium sp. HKCCYLS20291]|uniref:DUF4261 domain-containing protein n=1 Tax=Bradyrhizobium sp. HKCCYLS20291 TaxID=3420766 RepID=UPI003EBDE125
MQFSARLLLEHPQSVSASQIQAQLVQLAPGTKIDLPMGSTAASAAGADIIININDEPISVTSIPAPAELQVVEREHYANHIWPSFEADTARQSAHIIVAATRDVSQREPALAQARAVTLATAAIARLISFIGVQWVEGTNSISAAGFIRATETIGRQDANAVPFWVRILMYPDKSKSDQPRIIGGTLGLHFFGLLDLEYPACSLEPRLLMQHAYATAEYLLGSGKSLLDGETIGVEGESPAFKVSYARDGVFVPFPVARLNAISGKKRWWRW